jgi:hypothetical protein
MENIKINKGPGIKTTSILLAFPYYFEISKIPENIQFDPIDKNIFRPKTKLIRAKRDYFELFEYP